MEELNIRRYTEGDRAALVRLTEELQDFLIAIDPLGRLLRKPEYGEHYTDHVLSEALQNSGRVLLAVVDSEVVGYIAGKIDEESVDAGIGYIPTKAGRITELVVKPSIRSRGVGARLMDALRVYFENSSCNLIRVEVFAPNARAVKFYERMGYEIRTVDMVRVIPESNPAENPT